WFSSGVATDAPIVWGLAPGNWAVTRSVGKSTLGRSLTGRERYATVPNNAMAAMRRLVAIGRLMNPSEMFISTTLGSEWGLTPISFDRGVRPHSDPGDPSGLHHARQVRVDHRCQV